MVYTACIRGCPGRLGKSVIQWANVSNPVPSSEKRADGNAGAGSSAYRGSRATRFSHATRNVARADSEGADEAYHRDRAEPERDRGRLIRGICRPTPQMVRLRLSHVALSKLNHSGQSFGNPAEPIGKNGNNTMKSTVMWWRRDRDTMTLVHIPLISQ